MVSIVAPSSALEPSPLNTRADYMNPNYFVPNYLENKKLEKELKIKNRNKEASRFLEGDFIEGEDLEESWTKFDLAKSKTLTAKQQKWKEKYYPSGVLTQMTLPLTKETKLIFKKTPQDKFRFVDIGWNLPEIAGAAVSGETVGGMVGSVLGPLGTVGGTIIGSLAETGVEKIRGYDVPGPGSEVKEALTEGAIAGVFDVATRGALKVFKTISRGGIAKSLDTASFSGDIAKFAEEQTLKPLVIGQVAKRPIVYSLYSQVGGTSPIVQDITEAQLKSLRANFGKIAKDFDASKFSETELRVLLKMQQDDLLNQTIKNFKGGTLVESFEKSNQALTKGIERWKINSRIMRDDLYADAFKVTDDFSFDLRPLQQKAIEINRPIKMLEKQKFVEQVKGFKIGDTGVEEKVVGQIPLKRKLIDVQDIPQEIKDMVQTLGKLDSTVSKIQFQGQVFRPFEQMKALRTDLYYLQQEKGNTGRLANELYNSLKQVMDNPITGSDEALRVYKDAAAYNLYRETTLKIPIVAKVLKTETPEDVVRLYFSNTQPAEVKLIKELIKPEEFTTLKNAYTFNMMNDSSSLNKFVKNIKLNEKTTNLIYNPDEIKALTKYQHQISKLNESQLAISVSKDVTNFDRFVMLSQEGPEVLEKAIQAAGGKNSKFVQSLKAGAYKKILDDATITDPKAGLEYLDTQKVYAGLDALYTNKNLMKFVFNKADLAKLENFGLYTILVNRGQDVGGQIQVGALASKIGSPLRPVKLAGALVKLKQNDFIAKLLSQPYKKTLNYKQSPNWAKNKILQLSIMVNSMIRQLDDERKKRVLIHPTLKKGINE
tara:strand:+ start:1036 stop:3513 length:2478 start_codon:yes stop_codon:yes gene_type:complete